MRTRTVCGVCFDPCYRDLKGGPWWHKWTGLPNPLAEPEHRARPITVRVCEAGTCENLADVLANGRAWCSNHALGWALAEALS